MIKNLIFEFYNYIFFYAKINNILTALFKKKKLKKYSSFFYEIKKVNKYFEESEKKVIFESKIKLNEKFHLNIFNEKYNFSKTNLFNLKNKFYDNEILFYILRFNWLHFDNDHLSKKQKIDLIIYFANNFDINKSDTYSVSERISNWILFLKANENNISSNILLVIKQSIDKQIFYLIKNLEFHNKKTNNHLLSNNKSLFLYSTYYNITKYDNLSLKIFDFLTDHIFFRSGFLNEGSSHYHLLIAKHCIEILYFNKLNKKLKPSHEKFFLKVISNIHIFTINEDLVNFGDSTPDLPIKYLRFLPYISYKLFGINYPLVYQNDNLDRSCYSSVYNLGPLKKSKLKEKNYSFFDKESGHLVVKYNSLLFYSLLSNSNIIKPRSHRHTDIGNFIIYYKDKPIFIDLGRLNYNKKSILNIGASYHNSFKLNNLEPLLCHKLNSIPSLMHKNYFQQKPKYYLNIGKNKAKVIFQFFGYKRFPFKSKIIREINIFSNEIEIIDVIKSKKTTNYQSFFHTALNVEKINNNHYNLKQKEKILCEFSKIDEDSIINTFISKCSNEYGLLKSAHSIKVSKKLKKQDKIKYKIKFK